MDTRSKVDWHRRCTTGLVLALALLLPACEKAPLGVGFLGGLTGHAADLGTAGRDGALLAVEQVNLLGGIGGVSVKLHEFDDQQQPGDLPQVMQAVQRTGVLGLVGPMTSSIAKEWIPLANQAALLTVSPTVTSSDFTGQDDFFFRVISDTQTYARASAAHYAKGSQRRRFAVALDENNAAYTRSWLKHFKVATQVHGATLVSEIGFGLAGSLPIAEVVRQSLAARPDAMVLIANAPDTARIVQMVRKENALLPLMAAEWSATEQLLMLGGRAVEGLRIAQFMDHQSTTPNYLKFVADFRQRFGRTPGFAEVAAFDAMRVMLQALAQRQPGESLKASMLRIRRFQGLQQLIEFDDWGDSSRQVVLTTVQDGRYQAETSP